MNYRTSVDGDSTPTRATVDASARIKRAVGAGLALAAAALLSACGGGSGAAVEQNPGSGTVNVSSYTGPAPATDDVQSFKINLWDNIRATNRCGTCHSVEGGQTPMFARGDDVNLAYAAANGVVTLASPEDSVMVTKVGGGHNCWLGSRSTELATCADLLTNWITNWAGELASSGGRQIELKPPTLRDPGQSKNFPADAGGLFSTTVYPVLTGVGKCVDCHSSTSAVKQQPFFAEGPPGDAAALLIAYEAAKAKIDLDDPANSRFVLRLRNESHNCWTASCASDANAMEAAILALANQVSPTQVDPQLKTSKALTLYEGTVASGGNRYENSMIALYEFKSGTDCGDSITGACATAYDTLAQGGTGVDLHLSGNVKWVGGWGLNFQGGKAQASTSASAKIAQLVQATGEYSIEAWVAPGNVVQEDMRIVSYSGGLTARNFALGQTMYNYDFFNRSSNTGANGDPGLSTPNADEVLQATLQHVVATFDPVEGRKIYVNGELKASLDPQPGGTLGEWDNSFALVLGNEVSGNRNWAGVIRLVALFNRALSPEQIKQNFDAGVGEKFFLMFSVEHLTSIPQSYVVMEASQYDSYSYLFRKPFFISLDGNADPLGLDIEHVRIGLNGAEAHVGQSYAKLTKQISAAYTAAAGERLTELGAVVPLEKGPTEDEFFLTFDTIGTSTFNRPPPVSQPAMTAQSLPPLPPASDIGVRTFDEIDATLSVITGVSQLDPGVQATYAEVRQSLPAIESIEAFLSSHQASIAQLAIEYCNSMVDNTALRASRFPGFPFDQPVATAWPGAGAVEDLFINPLLDRLLGTAGTPIATAPDRAAVKAELTALVHGGHAPRPGLVSMTSDTSAARTQAIAKGVCAAAIGNGAALVQ
jgi:hypothetical protein